MHNFLSCQFEDMLKFRVVRDFKDFMNMELNACPLNELKNKSERCQRVFELKKQT